MKQMQELGELLKLLKSVESLSEAHELDIQATSRLLEQTRGVVQVMKEMSKTMQCTDAKSDKVCATLGDRCNWGDGVCSDTIIPPTTPVVEKHKVVIRDRGMSKDVKHLKDEVTSEASPAVQPVVNSSELGDMIQTLGSIPTTIKHIKSRMRIPQKKTMLGISVVTALLTVMSQLQSQTLAPSVDVPVALLDSMSNSAAGILSEGASMMPGVWPEGTSVLSEGASMLPGVPEGPGMLGATLVMQLMTGIRWLMKQRNLPKKTRQKLEKSASKYMNSSKEIESLHETIRALTDRCTEKEEQNLKLRSETDVLREQMERVHKAAVTSANETEDLEKCRRDLLRLKNSADMVTGAINVKHQQAEQNQEELEQIRKQLEEKEREYNNLKLKFSSDIEELKRCNKQLEKNQDTINLLSQTDVGKALAIAEEKNRKERETQALARYSTDRIIPQWEFQDDPNAYEMAEARLKLLVEEFNDLNHRIEQDGDLSLEKRRDEVSVLLDWFVHYKEKTRRYKEMLVEKMEEERKKDAIFNTVVVPIQLSFFGDVGNYGLATRFPQEEEVKSTIQTYIDNVLGRVEVGTECDHVYRLVWSVIDADSLSKDVSVANAPTVVEDVPRVKTYRPYVTPVEQSTHRKPPVRSDTTIDQSTQHKVKLPVQSVADLKSVVLTE